IMVFQRLENLTAKGLSNFFAEKLLTIWNPRKFQPENRLFCKEIHRETTENSWQAAGFSRSPRKIIFGPLAFRPGSWFSARGALFILAENGPKISEKRNAEDIFRIFRGS
ncbi:MAG: hypothetical protein SOT82_00390, partial [Oscillospiraceae bacterium]|nr:hypothetical protein [Oscillospiraceae bacterium]